MLTASGWTRFFIFDPKFLFYYFNMLSWIYFFALKSEQPSKALSIVWKLKKWGKIWEGISFNEFHCLFFLHFEICTFELMAHSRHEVEQLFFSSSSSALVCLSWDMFSFCYVFLLNLVEEKGIKARHISNVL